jgi:hypothetical protein
MSTDSDHKPLGSGKSIFVHGVANDGAKPPDKPMTAAQRRGLARKITAYLKRSGLDCELVEEDRDPPRMLN